MITDSIDVGKHSIPRLDDLCSSTTAFPGTKALALHWLQQCCSSHETCNDDSDRAGWNPTRLLDVGVAPDDTIKLTDTTSSTEAWTYVTLSHRWGQIDMPVLTRNTESQFKQGIQVQSLPRTYQHAITVVREMRYRYLWIDSLCIRQDQDDLSDWLQEASLMHKVYGHGHFNISATGAVDGSEGLFRQRDHTAKGFEKVFLQVEGLNGGPTPCIAFNSSFWGDNVEMAPLNLRGWVLQERILSKRVLHFGKTQLLWECRKLMAAETFPDGLLYDRSWPMGIKCLEAELRDTHTERDSDFDPNYLAHRLWTEIASTYSRCSLTKSEDKVLAITGLAKHMKGLAKDMYVAGMWRKNLASELAWRVRVDKSMKISRSDTYVAPTWSWLSCDMQVSFSPASEKGKRLNIKGVDFEFATEDPFGQLLGGRLYLEGILRRIRIHRDPDLERVSTSAWSLSLPDYLSLSSPGDYEDVVYLDIFPENFEAENDDDRLFCMELIDDIEWWAELDLLLLKCEDKAQGTFSRVGLSIAHDHRKKLLADRKRVPDFPCVSWDAKKRLHTICVI